MSGLNTVPGKSVAIGTNLGRVAARSPVEFEVEARNAADRPSKNGGDSIKVKFSAPPSAPREASPSWLET